MNTMLYEASVYDAIPVGEATEIVPDGTLGVESAWPFMFPETWELEQKVGVESVYDPTLPGYRADRGWTGRL